MTNQPALTGQRAVYAGRGLINNKIVHGWVPEDATDAEPSWFAKGTVRAIGHVYEVQAYREGDTFTRLMPGSEVFTGDRVEGDAVRLGWEARDRQAYRSDQTRKDEARARRETVLDAEAERLATRLLKGCRDSREAQTRLRMLTDAALSAWFHEHQRQN